MKTASIFLTALILAPLVALRAADAPAKPASTIAADFASPPVAAKPFVHWYWQIPTTPERITQDLEAMHRAGIQGARVYPFGAYMAPGWPETFKHLLAESERLGMQIHLNNDRDWSCKALPWMTLEHAQKRIIRTATPVSGGRMVRTTLPRAEINDEAFKLWSELYTPKGETPPVNTYYRDIAVLAVRNIPGSKPLPSQGPESGLVWDTQPFGLKTGEVNYPSYPAGAYDILYEPRWLDNGVSVPAPENVVDLTAKMEPDGTVEWDVPEGQWTVLRFGCTVSDPRRPDFLRKDALDHHLKETVEKLLPGEQAQVGKTWTHMQFDSWENGQPTWTPDFVKEFRTRRGYDPTPWLPVLAGIPIGSAELSDRFLHDYRRTISDLTVENHFAHWTARLRDMGLQFTTQGAYGWSSPIADSLRIFGSVDMPQGEIWHPQRHQLTGKLQARQFNIHKVAMDDPLAPRNLSFGTGLNSIRLAASASHIYGKPVCSAEVFTSYYDLPGLSHYTESPEAPVAYRLCDPPVGLRTTADRAFCDGLQTCAYHVYTTQPADREGALHAWRDVGIHFNRNMTWWNQSHAFSEYLARCSALLQRGRFVADFAYWTGDGIPYECPDRRAMRPSLPWGSNADLVNTDVLLHRLSVRDGRLVLPDGVFYRYLVLPPTLNKADPTSLRRIKELAEAGATMLLGAKPVSAIGLAGYPGCDAEVRQLADDLWGTDQKPAAGIRTLGKGRVVLGMNPAEILKADFIPEDVQVADRAGAKDFDWIHRREDGSHLYFVSNQSDETKKAVFRFRVAGAKPEWWDPVDGSRRALPEFEAKDGVTAVPLEFAPGQSAFVVFAPDSSAPDRFAGRNFPALETRKTLSGPWQVNFDPQRKGPGEVVFDSLQDWTTRPEEGVKFYAGTATYRKTFDLPDGAGTDSGPLYLNLGTVKDLAEVRLNGQPLGVVWTAPWRADISRAAKSKGNLLEIDVINQWPNRLIGDARSPQEKPLIKSNLPPQDPAQPLLPSGLFGPVTLQTVKGAPSL
jgi:hypothetical protein